MFLRFVQVTSRWKSQILDRRSLLCQYFQKLLRRRGQMSFLFVHNFDGSAQVYAVKRQCFDEACLDFDCYSFRR